MSVFRLLLSSVAAMALSGCALTTDARLLQSQFAFPNSDLVPVGRVHGQLSMNTWFNPPTMDKAIFDKLTADALQEKSGETLIDFVVTSKTKFYPPLFFFFQTTYAVDGTAVRVGGGGPGRQGLR